MSTSKTKNEGKAVGQMKSTGEIITTAGPSDITTAPLEGEELEQYNADIKTLRGLQVDDPMSYQKTHGFYPPRGSTEVDSGGLTPADKEDVLAGRSKLELIDKDKGRYRAVARTAKKT